MTDYSPAVYWATERERIRVRKEVGDPFPWTDDPILRDYRFCCVRREDDRVTRWIKTNIRERFADHEHLWFMLCAARYINWPQTLHRLMRGWDYVDNTLFEGAWPYSDAFDPKLMGVALEAMSVSGSKVWTGAYMITAPAVKGAKKTTYIAEETLGQLWRKRDLISRVMRTSLMIYRPSLRVAWDMLRQFPGWGPFMAYQAVVDMRFCPSLLAGAHDVASWAAAGPGTIRGLNRMHGRRLDYPLSQRSALVEMLPLWEVLKRHVELDLSDVPNVCCETDKWLRVKNGEGTLRARYVPGRGS